MPHILLVDDNKYLLQAVTRALQTANPQWCITAASTIEEADVALQSLDQEYGRIEVVATDLVIGNDADAGMKVLEASKERDPLIEVILFTSYENALDRRAAFSFGAYDCLSKTIPGIHYRTLF